MKKLVIVPANRKSRSVKELAKTLSNKVGHKVYRVLPDRVRRRIPFVLNAGTDKLTQLTLFKQNDIPCPEFTTDRATAVAWLADGAVMCRKLLRSSEGKGIVVADTADKVVDAPLYTKYFKKKREFRVHVLNGNVIDVQEKRKRKDHGGERDTHVRNLANGYVFCRGDIVEPTGLRQVAAKAATVLGYTVGAVDVAYNEHYDKLCVLEVNACPGMQGSTLENYANGIADWWRAKNAL